MINLLVDQGPQVIPCNVAFCPLGPQPVVEQEVIYSQLQDFARALAELREAPVSPFFQPVWVPLKKSLAPQFGIVHKIAERTHPFIQVPNILIRQ